MPVAKITEISATSKKSFDDAVIVGLRRAEKTLQRHLGRVGQVDEGRLCKGQDHRLPGPAEVSFILKG
jgi:flavin-binding protein dodecin